MFIGCTFKINIYSTFNTHKNRKHNQHSLKDFKANIIRTSNQLHQSDIEDGSTESVDGDYENETLGSGDAVELHLPNLIIEKIACLLLKLENIVHTPKAVIDEILSELHYILSTVSLPVMRNIVSDIFQSHKLQIEESVVDELSTLLCKSNPLGIAIAKDGPLATAYSTQYYTSHFGVLEPVEYILDVYRNRF